MDKKKRFNIYFNKKYEMIMDISKESIIEEVININYYLIKSLREDNEKEIIKNQVLLNSLLKLYLKEWQE